MASQIQAALRRLRSGVTIEHVEEAVRFPLLTGLQPPEMWVLVSVLFHERRQRWVGHLAESRLSARGAEMARMGAWAHPQGIPQMGDVPGEDEWTYYFHGRGCEFTHRDGTVVDVDFADDGSALEIDSFFYNRFLETCPELHWCERQLKHPEGLADAWYFDLTRLGKLKLVEGEGRFRLSDAGRNLATALEPLVETLDAGDATARCFVLTLLGDHVATDKLARSRGLHANFLEEPTRRQMTQRCAALREALHGGDERLARSAMAALGTLGKGVAFEDACREIQQLPVRSLNQVALAALLQWEGTDVTQCLVETLTRLMDVPLSERLRRWMRASSFTSDVEERCRVELILGIADTLFGRMPPAQMSPHIRTTVERALSGDCRFRDAKAGFFLYLLDREDGRARLAANLFNPAPITRTEAACFVAMIGDEWSIDTLIRASHGPAECGGHEAACALALLDSERAQAAAIQWQRRNDGYEDVEGHEIEIQGQKIRSYSMDEMTRSHLREDLRQSFHAILEEFGPLLMSWTGKPTRHQSPGSDGH